MTQSGGGRAENTFFPVTLKYIISKKVVGAEVPPATPPLRALQLYVLTTTRVASAKLYALKISLHVSTC